MILKKELNLNDSIACSGILCCCQFHPTSSLLFAIWVFFQILFPMLGLWMSKNLRVTSLQLIVLVDREEIHWVLVTLPFILGLWPHLIQWEWGNVEVNYKLLEDFEYSHSFLFTGTVLSPSHLLYMEDYP